MLHHFSEDQRMSLAFIGSKMKGVVHNINTPLSAIMGRAEMLQMRLNKMRSDAGSQMDEAALGKCIKDIGIVLDNSVRVTEILRQVMQKCLNAENDHIQQINVADLLKHELEFLHADMDYKHSIDKTFTTEGKIPCINGHYLDFSNCFLEVIDNCIKAMKHSADKKLGIHVQAFPGRIQVNFHDTGCGIAAEDAMRFNALLHEPLQATQADMQQCGGIVRIALILKKYSALCEIKSRPGDTNVRVDFPTVGLKHEE